MPSTGNTLSFGLNLFKLLFPVVDKRGRADDDRLGFGVFFVVLGDGDDRLQGFAQAHIVGQNPVEVHEAEPFQPGDPFHLVGCVGSALISLRYRFCVVMLVAEHLLLNLDERVGHLEI